MGRRAGDWLLVVHARHLAEACPWDSVCDIVGLVNVGKVNSNVDAELAAEVCFADLLHRQLQRHHALADALARRAGHLAVKARLMSASGGDGVAP